jgi:hypothetical protein
MVEARARSAAAEEDGSAFGVGKVFFTHPGSSRAMPGVRRPVMLKAIAMR